MSDELPQQDRFGREYDPDNPHGPKGYTIEVWCFKCQSYVKQKSVPPADPELACDHHYPDAIDPDLHDVDQERLLKLQLLALKRDIEAQQPGWRLMSLKELFREKAVALDELQDNSTEGSAP